MTPNPNETPADTRQAAVAANLARIAEFERNASPLAHNPGRS